MKSICVFCGSGVGNDPRFAQCAQSAGRLLAERGITLVYGGAHVGLMGMAADSALQAGGEVIGVMPRTMVDREIAHRGLTQLHIVETMHQRKALMASLSEGFIALPGGFGTLDEFFEVVTWAQLGIHRHPCGVVNVAGYFDGLLAFLDHATASGLVKPPHRALVLENCDVGALLDRMAAYQYTLASKWA